MVFVRKTYSGTRTMAARIGAAIMLVIGFITLVIMPSVKIPGHSFGNSVEIGIAHADAPSCADSSCDDDNCDCDCDCGDSGDDGV